MNVRRSAIAWLAIGVCIAASSSPALADGAIDAQDIERPAETSSARLASRIGEQPEKIEIRFANGAPLKTYLVALDGDSALVVTRTAASEAPLTRYALSDVSDVSVRRSRSLRPLWMVAGLIGGAVIGGVVGEATGDESAQDITAGAAGAVIGSVTGTLFGTALPFIAPGSETIHFEKRQE
jgi:uncharacterized protein YcfJ